MNFIKELNHYSLQGLPSGVKGIVAGKEALLFSYHGSLEEIRSNEYRELSAITGLERENIHFLQQVHGASLIDCDEKLPDSSRLVIGESDALVTSKKDTCLVIRTADCVPVMIYHEETTSLAMVHSGWKGTKENIVGSTVEYLVKSRGSVPSGIIAAILPSIGPEKYEVQDDVAQFFPKNVKPSGDRYLMDLWTVVHSQLIDTGIPEANIFQSNICTLRDNYRFFSHRGGDKGRNLNAAWII